LKKALDMGRFHHDLYRLISVLPIEVPPLGRRREDIPLLVSQFLQQATEGTGLTRIYSPKAVELLVTTDWPGNVRQLFEFVAKNVALSQDQVMTEKFVQHALGHDSTHVPSFDEAREEFTRNYLIKNLQSTRGNVSKSARLAKRNRANFYKLLSRYRVSSGDFKSSARRSK
jgi:two-component system response regulator GlrR